MGLGGRVGSDKNRADCECTTSVCGVPHVCAKPQRTSGKDGAKRCGRKLKCWTTSCDNLLTWDNVGQYNHLMYLQNKQMCCPQRAQRATFSPL